MILAFLQNQWGPNADSERVAKIKAMPIETYTRYVGMCLFAGCITGQRIEATFGEEACEKIVWANASREAGNVSSAKYAACIEHIAELMEHYKPECVLLFGNVAQIGFGMWALRLDAFSPKVIRGPHPVARYSRAPLELIRMAQDLKSWEDYRVRHESGVLP